MKRTLVGVALILGGCLRGPAPRLPGVSLEAAETRSNVLRADYVGSAACASCHAAEYAKWAGSPMRNMTRAPERAQVRAPFAGETFAFKGDRATLFRSGESLLVRVATSEPSSRLFRVTRIIGNHYREDFAGVEIASPEQPVERGSGPELILPMTYHFESHGYRPKGYSVMTGERPGLHVGGEWNRTCIFCHNTVPWLDTALAAFAGPAPPSYQGALVDHTLPASLRFTYQVTAPGHFVAALAREAAFLGAPLPPGTDRHVAARAAIRLLASRFQGRHLVEEGIGCEACHGGGREHVADPRVRTSFTPRADFLDVAPASGASPSRAWLINRTCARCHQVLFSRYPFTWEGGARYGGNPGGSSTTSGEARDFLLGGPGRHLACTACHDPHALDRPESLARLATPAANGVCTRCHPGFATREGLAEHAHHDPDGAAGACVACHMPRKNMALDYRLTRYHRIGSPTDRARVELDRPLECALCHGDRSTATLIADMERLWDKRYDRDRLRALYGSLDDNNLGATLTHGKPHEQVAAALAMAEQRIDGAAPLIAHLLTSPYPLARRFGATALARAAPGRCPVDVDASVAEIHAALARCGWEAPVRPAPPPGHVGEINDED